MTPRLAAALRRYRIMALLVGIGLLVLCLEILLKYGFDNPVLDWWAQVHGFLYILYVIVAADLGLTARWSLRRILLVLLAGTVPFFSFLMERRIVASVLAADSTVDRLAE
ncbi:MAG: DUF3817 domain-containing protein [Angustibacter sp.]